MPDPMTLDEAVQRCLSLLPPERPRPDLLPGDEEAIRTVLAALADAQNHLGSLLARIHRDGGHYEQQHGTAKAAEDAERVVLEDRAERDACQEAVARYQYAYDAEKARADAAWETVKDCQEEYAALEADAAALRKALERMISPETDWENGAVGVGYTFREIARAALARPAGAALGRLRALEASCREMAKIIEYVPDLTGIIKPREMKVRALAALDALKEKRRDPIP